MRPDKFRLHWEYELQQSFYSMSGKVSLTEPHIQITLLMERHDLVEYTAHQTLVVSRGGNRGCGI